MDIGFLIPILVIVATAVAPFLTEWVKNGADGLFGGLPQAFKPLVHVLVSAAVAGLVGSIFGSPYDGLAVGGATGVVSSAGFFVGKRS